MLILNVTYTCVPGKREELRELIRSEGIDVASRSEEGNFKYDFYLSTENPDHLLLVEYWKDVEAWQNHRTLPHYNRLSELLDGRLLDKDVQKSFAVEE